MRNELERLITEANLLQDARRSIDKAIADIEGPLHIAQECLYQRESRQGMFFECFNKKNSTSRRIPWSNLSFFSFKLVMLEFHKISLTKNY